MKYAIQTHKVLDGGTQKRLVRKLYVGKNAVLRDTAALASSHLTGDVQGVISFRYTFRNAVHVDGDLIFKFWIADALPADSRFSVRLDRSAATRAHEVAAPLVQLPCITHFLHEPDGEGAEQSRDVNSSAKSALVISLQLKTDPVYFDIDEQLKLTLQFCSDRGMGPIANPKIKFGGLCPSQLIIEETVSAELPEQDQPRVLKHFGRADRRDRSEWILDAAENVFNDKGFSGAAISDIAAAAGVSHGHLYNFFASKDTLIFACIKRKLDHDIELVNRYVCGDSSDSLGDVGKFIEYILSEGILGLNSNIALEISIEMGRNSAVYEMVTTCEVKIKAVISKYVEQYNQSHGLDIDEASLSCCANLIYALLQGLRLSNRSNESNLDSNRLIALFSTALNSLVADAPILQSRCG